VSERVGENHISTVESARMLGLKRQAFLLLKNFFGIVPVDKRRLNGTTAPNFYNRADIECLRVSGQLCKEKGLRTIMGRIEEKV
jgi:hypothetical protein